MANVTANVPINMNSDWSYGVITSYDAHSIVITAGARQNIYSGNFTYDTLGNVYGQFTGYAETYNGAVNFQATGFNLDAFLFQRDAMRYTADYARSYVLNGADSISGSNEADILKGYGGADTINGRGGNDIIYAGAGSDALIGGAGRDTVIANQSFARSDVSFVQGYWVLGDLGTREADTLIEIERIDFGDRVIAVDVDGVAGQAYRLYQAAFARTPDKAGLSHNVRLMDNGLTLKDMSSAFIGSAEFQNKYGAAPTDTTYINALYQNVLGRAADAAGLAGWQQRLADGSWSRADVLIGFSESAENKALVGVAIAHGITLDAGTY